MKLYIHIFLATISFFLVGCISIPFNNPPKPSGKSQIGTQSIELIDLERLEWFTENPDDFRKIMIQVWYPTKDYQGQKELYIDYGDIRIKALAEQFEYKSFLFKGLTEIETNSFTNAKPDLNNKVPLIIFSHGLGGNRTQNTVMVEELASHGYVVVAIEHNTSIIKK